MYYNHNLRTNLQEWKNRLLKSTYDQFPRQLKFLLNNIESNKVLSGLIQEAYIQYPFDDIELQKISDNIYDLFDKIDYDNNQHQASFCFQFVKHLVKELKGYNLHQITEFTSSDFNTTKDTILDELISPIIYYFHDRLEKSNSVVYLLEKYKRRTEWFTKKSLLKAYNDATKNYEQIFEDDLRLFLFDQGIDYPFSTPKSTSGRADIIGSIDTSEPIIIEIKIFDREKSYGKNRIKDGFTQIIKYANDYNKEVGFLVIFNVDKAELNFDLKEKSMIFPPTVIFNHKTYFLITINLFEYTSASTIGTTEAITITEEDLTI